MDFKFLHDSVSKDSYFERIKKIMFNYSIACNVPCYLMNRLGDAIHQTKSQNATVRFDGDMSLKACFNKAIAGERSIFLGLMGSTFLASIIQREGCFEGVLVAGPVQIGEMDSDTKNIGQDLYGPIMSFEQIVSLKELLVLAARKISEIVFCSKDEINNSSEIEMNQCYYHIYPVPNDFIVENEPLYPMYKERLLLECVETKDKTGAQEVLNEILGAIFFAGKTNQPLILTRVTELVVLLSRAAIRGGADTQQIFGLNYTSLKKIQSFRTVDEIAYWLSDILARFTDQIFCNTVAKHEGIISHTKSYIRKNYNKKISLEEAAAQVYLSPAYFSRIFKEMIGENFNIYVNRVRIEVAKKYLINEKIPMIDISTFTGFEDQSYFSKVFKRMTGVTPYQFRESRGKVKSAQTA